jgi:sigma-E factor negative regulatory protein RseB
VTDRLHSCVLAWVMAVSASGLSAQTNVAPVVPAVVESKHGELGISDWLLRMHEASRKRAYIGTFVVSAGANMSSARIWHVCDGDLQMERVESLSGAPRSTFRRNEQVITFLPESKTALSEKRESLGLFPDLLRSADSAIEQFYAAKQTGTERVAGFDADVVVLQPKDSLRFGYRVWSEKKSGLVVKLQTLDVDGRVVEQAAFSELQLDAPVSMGKLTQMMGNTEGYRVEKLELVKTTAIAEGWTMKSTVAGFKPMSCYKRPVSAPDGANPESTMQWIFSDGLASVSLFVEAFDKRRHVHEGSMTMGATNTLTRRLSDKAGDWWLTVVGEVPRNTLMAFSEGLERKK